MSMFWASREFAVSGNCMMKCWNAELLISRLCNKGVQCLACTNWELYNFVRVQTQRLLGGKNLAQIAHKLHFPLHVM